jgi:hypothetical protein
LSNSALFLSECDKEIQDKNKTECDKEIQDKNKTECDKEIQDKNNQAIENKIKGQETEMKVDVSRFWRAVVSFIVH